VDDNATNRFVLREFLRSWGCRFHEAPDGEQALVMLRQAHTGDDPFRIALLDMQMPNLDGETLGRRIKADPDLRHTHLIMLTSMGKKGIAEQLFQVGFAACLGKPVKKRLLHESLIKICGTQPAAPANFSAAPDPLPTPQEQRRNKFSILVAEDNIVNQKVAIRLLEKFGYRADAVANGKEAVHSLEKIPYDLVLMDVQMPEMDGLSATRAIRDPQSRVLDRKISIIAMTAHAMKEDRERCLEAGMDDYISKPVVPQVLKDILEKYLKHERSPSPQKP